MIELTRGNLLEADVEAVVNTVNTVGVMGKGIALQFKKAYPENYEAYRRACKAGEVQPGRMFVFEQPGLANPRFIINFPTKRHWKAKSRLADIEAGLEALVGEVDQRGIRSVAVPPLGCGHGGLDWREVLPRMKAAFERAPGVRWLVYEPAGEPAPADMKDRTTRSAMTKGRAAVIGLINRYLVPGFEYPISLLEVQKLVYFLQTAGEDLGRVEFARGHYGPYADVLRHVLGRLEGHYITGFGDGSNQPETPIRLLPGAGEEAIAFLAAHPDTRERFERVADLIEGFETPYGMELLATVHWVATREGAASPATALQAIQTWNLRKAKLMREAHVGAALARLRERGWLERPGGNTDPAAARRPGEPSGLIPDGV